MRVRVLTSFIAGGGAIVDPPAVLDISEGKARAWIAMRYVEPVEDAKEPTGCGEGESPPPGIYPGPGVIESRDPEAESRDPGRRRKGTRR
jgi:hypothetical protein